MASFAFLISLLVWTKLRMKVPRPLILPRTTLRSILGCSSLSCSSELLHHPPMLPAALGLCPGVTSMPSSLLCLEGNPNRHSREPVQRDLGCPPKRHDTIYNVSHKKADLDTGHNLMLQMECWAPGRLVLSSRERGCVPLTLQSSVLYSRLPDCFFHPSLWASPFAQPTLLSVSASGIQAWLPSLSHQTQA